MNRANSMAMPHRGLREFYPTVIVLFVLTSCDSGSPASQSPTEHRGLTEEPSSTATATSFPDTPAQTASETRAVDESTEPTLMPNVLDCSIIEMTEPGQTWNGLTVGLSTREQVEKRLASSAYSRVNPYTGNLEYVNNDRINNLANAEWYWVEVCFDTRRLLLALNVHITDEFPRSLDEWLDLYGQPDRVTWANDYLNRSLIWSERGILAVVGVDNSGGSANIVLFPPIPRGELDDSWLMASLPQSGGDFYGDEAPLRPELEVEDPWNIALEP